MRQNPPQKAGTASDCPPRDEKGIGSGNTCVLERGDSVFSFVMDMYILENFRTYRCQTYIGIWMDVDMCLNVYKYSSDLI